MESTTNQHRHGVTATTSEMHSLLLSYGIVLSVMLIWNFYAGKDLNWDAFNYHYYLPHSLVEWRLAQDFFAASVHSYLNPVPFLPFYLFNQLGWHSLLTASMLTVIHSLNYIALVLLIRVFHLFEDRRVLPCAIAATLCLISPVFLQVTGSSFIAATISVPYLFGLYFFLRSTTARDWFLGGLLLGCAVAMKFVLLLFIPPLVAFLIYHMASLNRNNVGALIIGGVVGVMLFGGWWFGLIWYHFGNPIFPFFNGIFKSPLLLVENIRDLTLLPKGVTTLLTLPVHMLSLQSYLYTESLAPDIRAALFFLLLPLFFICRHFSSHITLTRLQGCFLLYLVLSYVLWVWFSGNGRYGLVFLMLVGLGIAILLVKAWGVRRFYFYASLLIVLQSTFFLTQGYSRWIAKAWTADWFNVIEIPARYADTPALYLSMQRQTPTFLAPYFHRASQFISLDGIYSIGRHSGAGEKIHHMIRNHQGAIKVIYRFNPIFLDKSGSKPLTISNHLKALTRQREFFFEYDLDLLPDTCSSFPLGDDPLPNKLIIICNLVKKAAPPEYWQEQAEHERFFAHVENACPDLSPKGARMKKTNKSWKKYYFSHGLNLITNDDFMIAAKNFNAPAPIKIAPIDELLTTEFTSCPLDKLKRFNLPLFE